MRPAKPIKEEDKKSLEGLLQKVRSKPDFQSVQSVWLRAAFNMTAPEISKATGLKQSTVNINNFHYFSEGISSLIGCWKRRKTQCKFNKGRRERTFA